MFDAPLTLQLGEGLLRDGRFAYTELQLSPA